MRCQLDCRTGQERSTRAPRYNRKEAWLVPSARRDLAVAHIANLISRRTQLCTRDAFRRNIPIHVAHIDPPRSTVHRSRSSRGNHVRRPSATESRAERMEASAYLRISLSFCVRGRRGGQGRAAGSKHVKKAGTPKRKGGSIRIPPGRASAANESYPSGASTERSSNSSTSVSVTWK